MTFTLGNALAFSAEGWLLLGAVVVIAVARFGRRDAAVGMTIALVALALSLSALLTQLRGRIAIFDDAYVIDGYALYVQLIVLVAAAMTLLLGRLERALPPAPAFPAFVLLATIGGMLAAGAGEMAVLFIAAALLLTGVAWMSVFAEAEVRGSPAAFRVLGAGSLSAGLLGLGLVLLFGLTGTSSLAHAGTVLAARHQLDPAAVAALVLIVGGCGAIVGIVPVHALIAGAMRSQAAVVVGFTGTVAAAVMFSVLTRILGVAFGHAQVRVALVLAIVAAVTMVSGYLFALGQGSLRRLLAGAMIGQSGYALAAIVGLRHGGVGAMLLAVLSIAMTNFALVAALSAYAQLVHSDRIGDLAGMSVHAPGTALVFALAVASAIGVPPLAGFFGKFLALQAAAGGGYAWLALVGALNSLLAAALFAPVVRTAYFESPLFEVEEFGPWPARSVVLGLAGVALLGLGIFLGPLSNWAQLAGQALLSPPS